MKGGYFFCLDIFDAEIQTDLISCVFPAFMVVWFSVYAVLFLHIMSSFFIGLFDKEQKMSETEIGRKWSESK